MEVSRIQKQLSKTGATEFVFEHLEIDLEGKVFLPMQQLNELRRQALEKLELEICGKFRRTSTEQPLLKQKIRRKGNGRGTAECSDRDFGTAGKCAGFRGSRTDLY